MKISRNKDEMLFADDAPAPEISERPSPIHIPPELKGPWKILVVDDEEDIHVVTTLALRGFHFDGLPLKFLHAMSGSEARQVLDQHPDIALALVDVVMESDDAGLQLVDHIRKELNNSLIRLIIRTGQPGAAPEKRVIDLYDIDDYKEKTELTVQKLYTAVRGTLKAYRDLLVIEKNRQALERILAAIPHLYLTTSHSFNEFFHGVLTQVISVCNLKQNGIIATVNGFLARCGKGTPIEARLGDFVTGSNDYDRATVIEKICHNTLLGHPDPGTLPEHSLLIPLKSETEIFGYIYLESKDQIEVCNTHLLEVLGTQISAAIANFQAHQTLMQRQQLALICLEKAIQNGATQAIKDVLTETARRDPDDLLRQTASEFLDQLHLGSPT